MRDSLPHKHKKFQKISTVRSPSAALALQHVFGSTRDREFSITNSGSILTHKASTPTRHAMNDSLMFLHRLETLQQQHTTSNRQLDDSATTTTMIHYEEPYRRRKTNAVETVAATDCGIRLCTSTGEVSTASSTSTTYE